MREYARTEIIREKCHFCGCKNKLFTELIKADHTEIGMVLRCCNCGKLTFHINPGLGIDVVENYINHKIYAGKSKCIQESYCPHTHCALYGTCGGNRKPPKGRRYLPNKNKLLDSSKLVVKSKKEPYYR